MCVVMEVCIRLFCCLPKDDSCLQRGHLFELQTELASFFMEHNFYLKQKLMVNYNIHIWVFGIFAKKKKGNVGSLWLHEKQSTSLINFKLFKLVLQSWEVLSATMSLASSQHSKIFLVRFVVILLNIIFLVLYNKMSYHLEDLHISVNHYFPNVCVITHTFIMGDRPMNFNITVLTWSKITHDN